MKSSQINLSFLRNQIGPVVNKIKKNPLLAIYSLGIIAIAVFFRFYNYFGRLNIQSDDSRFVIAAKYGLDHLRIPLVGPFPQAPFFTGPWWLWILGLSYIFPLGLFTPWILRSLLSLVFVFLCFRVGKEIENKWLGFLTAFFAAISTAVIIDSFSVWNAALDSLVGISSIYLFIKFYRERKSRHIFFLSFLISLTITIHFQTALLLPMILISLFISKSRLKHLGLVLLAFALTFSPFVIFDLKNHGYWIRSLFIYLTIDQYRNYYPNRWLSYLFVYWPNSWKDIIGGNVIVSSFLISLFSVFSSLKLLRPRKFLMFNLLVVAFAISIFMFKSYHGPRFAYFTVYAHPFVIVFSAWACFELWKRQKALGLVPIFVVTIFTLYSSYLDLSDRDVTVKKMENLKQEIYDSFPNRPIELYGCVYNSDLISFPLSYFIYEDHLTTGQKVKIGVCRNEDRTYFWKSLSQKDLEDKTLWHLRSAEEVHRAETEWWIIKPPEDSDFFNFLKKNFNSSCYPHC